MYTEQECQEEYQDKMATIAEVEAEISGDKIPTTPTLWELVDKISTRPKGWTSLKKSETLEYLQKQIQVRRKSLAQTYEQQISTIQQQDRDAILEKITGIRAPWWMDRSDALGEGSNVIRQSLWDLANRFDDMQDLARSARTVRLQYDRLRTIKAKLGQVVEGLLITEEIVRKEEERLHEEMVRIDPKKIENTFDLHWRLRETVLKKLLADGWSIQPPFKEGRLVQPPSKAEEKKEVNDKD